MSIELHPSLHNPKQIDGSKIAGFNDVYRTRYVLHQFVVSYCMSSVDIVDSFVCGEAPSNLMVNYYEIYIYTTLFHSDSLGPGNIHAFSLSFSIADSFRLKDFLPVLLIQPLFGFFVVLRRGFLVGLFFLEEEEEEEAVVSCRKACWLSQDRDAQKFRS